MSISKCVLEPTTRLVFLGIICNTEARRFEVPEGKLLNLEALLTTAITSGWIFFVDLERLPGSAQACPLPFHPPVCTRIICTNTLRNSAAREVE